MLSRNAFFSDVNEVGEGGVVVIKSTVRYRSVCGQFWTWLTTVAARRQLSWDCTGLGDVNVDGDVDPGRHSLYSFVTKFID